MRFPIQRFQTDNGREFTAPEGAGFTLEMGHQVSPYPSGRPTPEWQSRACSEEVESLFDEDREREFHHNRLLNRYYKSKPLYCL
jgi:hypothetical protein